MLGRRSRSADPTTAGGGALACPHQPPTPRKPTTSDEEIIKADWPIGRLRALRGRAAGADRGRVQEGFEKLDDVGHAVCVFGSARTTPGDEEYEEAREVGRAIGEAGMAVITGGGPGTMEAANRGAQRGGRSLGGAQHRAARRAGAESLRRPRNRVPLLLRAQADVRALLRRLRLLPRRLRDTRRDLRGADPDPDRQGRRPPRRARGRRRVLAGPDGVDGAAPAGARTPLGRGPGAGGAGRRSRGRDGGSALRRRSLGRALGGPDSARAPGPRRRPCDPPARRRGSRACSRRSARPSARG